MIAALGQTFAVLLIVAAAAGYLLVILRKSWKSGHGGACSGCPAHAQAGIPRLENGVVGDRPTDSGHGEPDAPPRPHTMFVPIENFADVARRHGQARRTAEARHEDRYTSFSNDLASREEPPT